MKKLLLLVVTLLVLGTLTACGSKDKGPAGELVIGTPPLNGDFVTGFSNSAYDRMVTDMIGGYATYETTPGGEFVLNKTAVKDVATETDAAGNKTYTFTLNAGLKWSDGEPVTAEDYVFGVLLASSAEWGAVTQGQNLGGMDFVGWEAYAKGTSDVFAGVHLLADDKFSVTLTAEELPYFYEFAMATVGPSPLHAWANGAKVESTDAGAKLVFGADPLTAETAASEDAVIGKVFASMKEVADNINKTERYAPSVSSGPFKFVSYENETATVEFNEHFAGDYRGEKAKLERVLVKRINEKLDVDYVISGDIDITTGVVEGAKIQKAKANENAVSMVSYPRSGYGFLSFHTDFGPVAEKEVRHAVAYSIDRDKFVLDILEGYGKLVNGEYGLSQWMYIQKQAELDEKLTNFVNNAEKANELLDSSTYKFDKDGKPFDASKAGEGYYRYNDKGEKLVINHAGSTNNPITDLIATMLKPNLAAAGIEFNIDLLDFQAMLDFYQMPNTQTQVLGARKYHTFNLATSFSAVYDPYTSLHSDYFGTRYNSTQTKNPELDKLITTMRRLDASEKDAYADAWLEYQIAWNDYLPMVPLYSNEYYDIFSSRVKNVTTSPVYGIGRAAIDVTVE